MRKPSLILLILAATLYLKTSYSQELEWDFPIKPKTEQWKTLKNAQERVDACQIDKEKLRTISSKGLVRICMEHPFFRGYIGYDNPIEGLCKHWGENFNGYTELMSRKDGIKSIVSVLMEENFQKLESIKDSVERGRQTLKWIGLEMMIYNTAAINNLATDDKIDIIKKLSLKLEEKNKYQSDFGGMGFTSTLFVSRKLLKSLGVDISSKTSATQKEYDFFDKTMLLYDVSIANEMLAQIKTFNEQKN
jgi:hypothetical protein